MAKANKPRRMARRLLIGLFTGGTLFQAAGCPAGSNELAAELAAAWATAIADNFIASWMNQRFRVPSYTLGT